MHCFQAACRLYACRQGLFFIALYLIAMYFSSVSSQLSLLSLLNNNLDRHSGPAVGPAKLNSHNGLNFETLTDHSIHAHLQACTVI